MGFVIETDSGGFPVVVEDLDEDWLLALTEESEVQSRAAARRQLRYALQWARLHPARIEEDAATWGDLGGRVRDIDRDCDLRLGGAGTPDIEAFAAEPFAAALGVSTRAGMALIADALDLAHRLPRAQRLVDDLEVAPWRARRLAQATRSLSLEAARHVDRVLAPVLDSCGPARIEKAVDQARAEFDAAEQADEEEAQAAGWGVRLEHGRLGRYAGTSVLEIIGDTPTLTRFHDQLSAIAREADPAVDLETRKVQAIATILDRATGTPSGATGTKTKLYLHLDGDQLADPTVGVGAAERLGPVTTGLIKQWLDQTRLTVVPVLRMERGDAVDQHDPPAWMRELVILRDRRCVYPYCDRDARDCDLDHIKAYVEMHDGGPPGQTNPDNLAPLCRGHHRLKTFGGWTYARNSDGTYTWHSPQGRSYTRTTDGAIHAH
jgi:hypothetical protein